MMSDDIPTTESSDVPQPKIRAFTTPPSGLIETYSNFININWGVFDLRIRFGQILPISGEAEEAGKGPERVVQERVAVTLAWPEAKLLRDLLIDSVKRYEETNGELKIPSLPR